MKTYTSLIFALLLATPALGVTMNRCSLAREMLSLGVAKDQLARWACIAEHESAFQTAVVGKTNKNGSNDYGIFQINNYYWCQPASDRFSYNQCNIDCNQLLTDDIGPSVGCAQKILGMQGWSAWATWRYCNGELPSIDDCFKC